jgi:hypothetical protein
MAESGARLVGWLFDQEHGLFAYAPIYLLAPAGWLALRRRDPERWRAITAIILVYVGVMTVPFLNWAGWRGGWSPAARFLVPIVPLLAVLVCAAIAQLERLPMALRALVAIQIGADLILWQHPGLLWNDGTGTSALFKFLDRGSGALSHLAPSLATPMTERTIVSLTVILSVWCTLTVWLWFAGSRDQIRVSKRP